MSESNRKRRTPAAKLSYWREQVAKTPVPGHLCLNWPVAAPFSTSGSAKISVSRKWGQKNFRGCTPKVQMSKMGGDLLKIPQATVVSFLVQPRIK